MTRYILPPRWVAGALVLAVAVMLVPRVDAGPPTEQLRSQIERVVKALEDPQLKQESHATERRQAVRKIAEEIFDFAETARRALGRHWAARTPAEREEFVRLFADLLERSYIARIDLYSGERITYAGDTVDGDQATVRTRIVTRQGSEIPVDYRMLRKNDRWLVYDVIIEGVSLIANYRNQFNRIIQTSSYQELIKKMKTRQEELLDDDKPRRTS